MPVDWSGIEDALDSYMLFEIGYGVIGPALDITMGWIVENRYWRDDTGSMFEATQSFLYTGGDAYPMDSHGPSVGDYESKGYENFFAFSSNWEDAQTGARKSRWLSRYPENTPDHYKPYIVSRDMGESSVHPVGVITSFVVYAEEVEFGVYGGTFHEAAVVAADAVGEMLMQLRPFDNLFPSREMYGPTFMSADWNNLNYHTDKTRNP